MLCVMSAEMQKMKRTFSLKLLWIAPLVPLFCAYGGGQLSGFYFWYVAFLPGALTIICSMIMLKDSKMKYRGILSLPVNKGALWIGKVMASSLMLFFSCAVFLFLTIIFGLIPPYTGIGHIPTITVFAASSLLFITFLWQIPFCLFLSAKFGIFFTIITNMLFNIIGGAAFADGAMWIFPFAISVRLMSPVLQILPNGLPAKRGSLLLNSSVILPGILVSLALFVVILMLTTAWFCRQEAK
ncbi:MAG: lantibiotic immunity ABC transporter MutE/EpiE family permease subunit [Velocimicrobium sp.]